MGRRKSKHRQYLASLGSATLLASVLEAVSVTNVLENQELWGGYVRTVQVLVSGLYPDVQSAARACVPRTAQARVLHAWAELWLQVLPLFPKLSSAGFASNSGHRSWLHQLRAISKPET